MDRTYDEPTADRPTDLSRSKFRWPVCTVVFHADDFGMNAAVTDGILRGFTHGLLTSTSLLANAPDSEHALQAWQRLEYQRAAARLPSAAARRTLQEPSVPFDLGIHLNLTQGRPLTGGYPSELLDNEGRFCPIGRLFRHLHRRRRQFDDRVRSELAAQIEFLLDRKVHPTHLNGHQYIELLPGLRDLIRELLVRYRIQGLRVARESGLARNTLFAGYPANWCLAHVKRFYAGRLWKYAHRWNVDIARTYFGTSHAGRIDLSLVRRFLICGHRNGPLEIGLHPATSATSRALDITAGWHDPLAALRPKELELLTSAGLIELLRRYGMSLGRVTRSVAATAAQPA